MKKILLILLFPLSIVAKDFINQDLSGKIFTHQDLSESTFKNCNLSNSDFSSTYLRETQFNNCNLTNTNFRNSTLEDAYFGKNNTFDDTDFRRASLKNAIFDTSYEKLEKNGVLFNRAKNIDSVQFKQRQKQPITVDKATQQPVVVVQQPQPAANYWGWWRRPYWERSYWGRPYRGRRWRR